MKAGKRCTFFLVVCLLAVLFTGAAKAEDDFYRYLLDQAQAQTQRTFRLQASEPLRRQLYGDIEVDGLLTSLTAQELPQPQEMIVLTADTEKLMTQMATDIPGMAQVSYDLLRALVGRITGSLHCAIVAGADWSQLSDANVAQVAAVESTFRTGDIFPYTGERRDPTLVVLVYGDGRMSLTDLSWPQNVEAVLVSSALLPCPEGVAASLGRTVQGMPQAVGAILDQGKVIQRTGFCGERLQALLQSLEE